MQVSKKLDREKQERHALLVRAKDAGQVSLSTDAELYVTLIDVNDNEPVFMATNITATSEVCFKRCKPNGFSQ